jgi:hypothetical protein
MLIFSELKFLGLSDAGKNFVETLSRNIHCLQTFKKASTFFSNSMLEIFCEYASLVTFKVSSSLQCSVGGSQFESAELSKFRVLQPAKARKLILNDKNKNG